MSTDRYQGWCWLSCDGYQGGGNCQAETEPVRGDRHGHASTAALGWATGSYDFCPVCCVGRCTECGSYLPDHGIGCTVPETPPERDEVLHWLAVAAGLVPR